MLRALSVFFCLCLPLAWSARYPTDANIRYSPYAETVLDVLQPHDPALKNRPGVILIHGGGWVTGNKEQMIDAFCVPFLEQGFVVANIDYRLANVAPAPAAIMDVLNAAHWFSEHAAEYKVDPRRIIAAGNSAGGHLALMLAMTPPGTDLGPAARIAAVVNFFGITDVADQVSGPNARKYAQAWIPDQPGRLDLARHLSPLTYVRKDVPPILTIHGDADNTVPYQQALALTEALKKVGAKTELITVQGGGHGFPPARMSELWPQIFKFLKKQKVLTNL